MASSFSPNSWHISSVEELMALAEAQERRAAARYDQLAARMDRFGSPETATLFRQLASMEREHVEALSDWAGPPAPQGSLPDDLGEGTAADSDEVPASLTPLPGACDCGAERGAGLQPSHLCRRECGKY